MLIAICCAREIANWHSSLYPHREQQISSQDRLKVAFVLCFGTQRSPWIYSFQWSVKVIWLTVANSFLILGQSLFCLSSGKRQFPCSGCTTRTGGKRAPSATAGRLGWGGCRNWANKLSSVHFQNGSSACLSDCSPSEFYQGSNRHREREMESIYYGSQRWPTCVPYVRFKI